MRNGFSGTALNFVNVSGAASTLGDLTVTGYEDLEDYAEGYSAGEIIINKVNDFGSELDGIVYYWFDFFNPDAGEAGEYWYGWYNDSGEECNDEPVELGEALMFQAPDDWVYVNFPKAF